MVYEAILNYFGTSSDEIAEKTREQEREIYEPQIKKLTSENDALKQLLKNMVFLIKILSLPLPMW